MRSSAWPTSTDAPPWPPWSTKALYDAKAEATGTPVFALTIAGFFDAPGVDEINLSAYTGQAGEEIAIRMHDDFALKGVAVAIRTNTSQVLAQGAADQGADSLWRYTATAALPAGQNVSIEVTAADFPGHQGIKTQPK